MAQPAPNNTRKLLVKFLQGQPQDVENFRQAAKAGTLNGSAAPARPPVNPPTQGLRWWDRSPVAKAVAGDVVRQSVLPLGAARGVVHTAKDLGEGAIFLNRLVNPLDGLLSAPGQSAQDQLDRGLLKAGAGVVNYVRNSSWRDVAGDAAKKLKDFRASIDPTATPQAPTLAGEIARNIPIGLNQGELAWNVGSTFFGGEVADGLMGVARVARPMTAAKYLAEGYPKGLAKYFSEAYPKKGMGHHFYPRGKVDEAPALLKPLARAFSESRYSVLKPQGLTKGEMYKLHYEVDPKYGGGKVPKEFGGGRWSGKDLGWQKHGLLGRVVYGSPAPLKAAVLGPSAIIADKIVDDAKSNGAKP